MKILLAILIAVSLTLAPTALADSGVAAYSDFTMGTPSPVVDQADDPNGYFDFVMGMPAVVYEFQETDTPAGGTVPGTVIFKGNTIFKGNSIIK